jgi:hypothetical protein
VFVAELRVFGVFGEDAAMKTLIVLSMFVAACDSGCGNHRDIGVVTPPVELTPDTDAGVCICDDDAGDRDD